MSIHGFWLVNARLLMACGTAFYAIKSVKKRRQQLLARAVRGLAVFCFYPLEDKIVNKECFPSIFKVQTVYTHFKTRYIEDIYFFEVNTKYISSNVLKISAISRVRR